MNSAENVFFWMLNVTQLINKFPTVESKSPQLSSQNTATGPILSQMKPSHIIEFHFNKNDLNLSSHLHLFPTYFSC